ncbi:MAG: hypothetical protein GY839_21045 [candidate division Zixibacteria bacterium]|nr:hypothetical protein [candidate division Zixibacteria bacterium]
MSRYKLLHFAFILMFPVVIMLGCDDYNIVEPRFYESADVKDRVRLIDGDRIGFDLSYVCEVDCYLLGSAGEVIEVFYENELLNPGDYTIDFDWRDDNGNIYPDGVYCFFVRACDDIVMNCFDYDEPEDN